MLERVTVRVIAALLLALALQACADDAAYAGRLGTGAQGRSANRPRDRQRPRPSEPDVTPPPEPEVPALLPSDGRPRRAVLRIPSIDVRVVVVPYVGWTDDAPGTDIQNGGLAASPHGPRGGVGPGGIGNYQVTAHRTSSTRAFELLPDVRRGRAGPGGRAVAPGERSHVMSTW